MAAAPSPGSNSLTLMLRRVGEAGGAPHGYLIADQLVCSDFSLPAVPTRLAGARVEWGPASTLTPREAFPTLAFAGPATLGDDLIEIECRSGEAGDRLWVAGGCEAQVNADGSSVLVALPSPPPSTDHLTSLLCGPVMALALARHGVFCLHASAVQSRCGTLLFVGQSGAGKSTLARRLAAQPGVVRVIDDITAIDAGGFHPQILPHFPQLKLAATAQWPVEAASRLPLGAICVLDHTQPAAATRRLGGGAAVARLLHHVVALTLLAPGPRQRALEACTALVRRVPVLELAYPHTPGSLEASVTSLAKYGLLPATAPDELPAHHMRRCLAQHYTGGSHVSHPGA